MRKLKNVIPVFSRILIPTLCIMFFTIACSPETGIIASGGGNGLTGFYTTPSTVNDTVDPVYTGIAYSQTKFVPPDGKYLLIGGQDKIMIADIPSAWTYSAGGYAHYFAVCDSNGIWSDCYIEGDHSNTQNAKWIADTHTNSILQMAMWIVGTNKYGVDFPANTTNHVYDIYLLSFCNFAKTCNRPIFLRIGYEFDGPHNMLDPGPFTNAYRYMVDYIRAQGVSNVAFVWHSWNNYTYNGHPIMSWYPGDDYVDWFGMSVFRDHVWDGNYMSYLDSFVNLAKTHLKPVMISESCPNGGITNNNYETWNRWFVPYFNYIHKKNIKAFSYINCNWDLIGMYGGQGWGNTRVQDYPLILTQWRNEISKDKYLKESTNLFPLLGYTN